VAFATFVRLRQQLNTTLPPPGPLSPEAQYRLGAAWALMTASWITGFFGLAAVAAGAAALQGSGKGVCGSGSGSGSGRGGRGGGGVSSGGGSTGFGSGAGTSTGAGLAGHGGVPPSSADSAPAADCDSDVHGAGVDGAGGLDGDEGLGGTGSGVGALDSGVEADDGLSKPALEALDVDLGLVEEGEEAAAPPALNPIQFKLGASFLRKAVRDIQQVRTDLGWRVVADCGGGVGVGLPPLCPASYARCCGHIPCVDLPCLRPTIRFTGTRLRQTVWMTR
jgi:hypothetical protein